MQFIQIPYHATKQRLQKDEVWLLNWKGFTIKNVFKWSWNEFMHLKQKIPSLANDRTISSFTILKQNYVDVVMGCAIIKMRHFHPLRLAAYFWLKNSDFAKAAGAPFVIVSKLSATSLCGTVKPRFVLNLSYFHTICLSQMVILDDLED